jgi:soluble lytic murein transglycosylase-like protein
MRRHSTFRTGVRRAAAALLAVGLLLQMPAAAAEPERSPGHSRAVVRTVQSAAPLTPANMVQRECAAAENGDPAAAYRLGRRYLFGMGVPRDKRMGVAWMRAAASRGYAPAIQIERLVPGNWGRMRPWCRPGAGPVHGISAPPAEIAALVNRIAPDFGLDPGLVLAVIQIESAYRTNAVSPKEAAGLMQLIPATASRFGVRDVFDPEENIRGGVKYLRWLLAYFQGDVTLALAAYNAGEGAVDRHGGIPPYAETQSYVRLVHRLYPATRHRYDPEASEPSPHFSQNGVETGRNKG